MIEGLDRRIADATSALELPEDRAPRSTILRGVRGLPSGRLAELIAGAYREDPPKLPDDRDALNALFGVAFEDGLAAIGLLATAIAQDPEVALELGLDWAARIDDVVSADAVGWLVLGPAAALLGSADGDRIGEVADQLRAHPGADGRRAAVSMALAYTPERIEGAAAAGLREQLGQRQVRIVDQVHPERIAAVVARFVRDGEPAVQKGLRRVLRAWADADPASLVAWGPTVPGGLPRMLGDEVKRARRAG